MTTVFSTGSMNVENIPDFVVHNYGLFRQTQSSGLLALGHELIRAASTRIGGWTNVGDAPLKVSRCTSIYEYYQPPTIVTDERSTSPRTIREWGMPLQDDEDIFTLNDLDDFLSTDFTLTSIEHNILPSVTSPTAENKQLNLDSGPLHNAIPQPHVHPSLHPTLSKPIKVTPYKRRKPTPIPPHTLPLAPPSPHSRSSWIIPIRGSLPWDGCTSAVVLDSSHKLPYPSQENDEPIAWTRASLLSFWAFLLNLRTTCNVGPIGLSFHASRPPLPQGGSSYNTAFSILGLGYQAVYESDTTTNPGSTATPTPSPPPISSVDHIKIYHEAPTAMYVRNALHVWAYQSEISMETGVTHEKIRLLKGARLILVDERAKGILIS